ncbi:hypothetical protein FRC08_010757 [Ceratobasidium sp. 394]|nr:hypothetical protein FRC08_010757 [Ceratobasidium sp. 394]
MSVDPETPHNQYAKVEYKIRIVGRIPRHTSTVSDAKTGYPFHKFKMMGTNLCAIDATMSHVAAMYAAGRLMDTIRQPFNASVIRAEMDALRSRDQAEITPEEFDKWKEEAGANEKFDPLVKEDGHDSSAARRQTPRCPYLFQLAYKSIYVGNDPPYWCGAREETLRKGKSHVGHLMNLDGPRHVMGRSGIDTFSWSESESWYLYIDVSEPLAPRYAFMQRTDIVGCTQNHDSPRLGTQLRIFNAQHHASRFLIPESEDWTEGEKFGEKQMERHMKCHRPSIGRSLLDQNYGRFKDDPEYQELIESREARARVHPAVERMKDFAWLREQDVLRPDGRALLQEVWSAAMDYANGRDGEVLEVLVRHAALLEVARSENPISNEPSSPKYWEYPFPEIADMALAGDKLSLISAKIAMEFLHGNVFGRYGVLAGLASLEATHSIAIVKAILAQRIWNESAKGGTGLRDVAYTWLKGDTSLSEGLEEEPWSPEDYDIPDSGAMEETPDTYSGMVMVYQGLCYRAAIAREHSRRNGDCENSTEESIRLSDFESKDLPSDIPHLISSGGFCEGEYPGRALGDVSHPAFDVSPFPRMREDQIICALKDWSQQIWMPNFDQSDWDHLACQGHSPPRVCPIICVRGLKGLSW